jgi:putative hydrolase of the HAD superfamily
MLWRTACQAQGGGLISPHQIRAILFDLDGTLRYNRPRFNDILAKYAIEYGAADTRANRQSAERWLHFYWAQSADAQLDMETFGEQSPAFWENHTRRYLIAFGHAPEHAERLAPEIYRRMSTEYDPQPWIPPEAFDVLRKLREAGFLVGIVSNRNHPLDDELEKFGLDGCIDLKLTAGEVNSWKPDPGIFLEAILRLEVNPAEVLYVGDNYYADVIGARNAGLHPVLLDPDGVFPEVECDVIRELHDLIDLCQHTLQNNR